MTRIEEKVFGATVVNKLILVDLNITLIMGRGTGTEADGGPINNRPKWP